MSEPAGIASVGLTGPTGLKADFVAGLSIAGLLLPEAVAYSGIAASAAGWRHCAVGGPRMLWADRQ